jgi:hypothetical protein
MKKALVLAILLALVAGFAAADLVYLLEVDIVNETGEIIEHVYIQPDYGSEWEEIPISEWVIRAGDTYTLQIRDHKDYNTDIFNVRLESRDGTTYTMSNQDLVATSRLVFGRNNRDA